MDPEEIMHIARSCGTVSGAAYYSRFAEKAAFRDLIALVAKDLKRVWPEGNDTLESCLARADQKLYEIKRARR